MHLIEFKICIIAGNGSRVVVTHQIFIFTLEAIFLQNRGALNSKSCIKNGAYLPQNKTYGVSKIIWNRMFDILSSGPDIKIRVSP